MAHTNYIIKCTSCGQFESAIVYQDGTDYKLHDSIASAVKYVLEAVPFWNGYSITEEDIFFIPPLSKPLKNQYVEEIKEDKEEFAARVDHLLELVQNVYDSVEIANKTKVYVSLKELNTLQDFIVNHFGED